jgi:thiamine biosynthesis lipoprotein
MAGPLPRRALFTRPQRSPTLPTEGFFIRVHRRMMACRVEVVLAGEQAPGMTHAAAALDEGSRLEDVMTIFREESELSGVNRDAHLAPVSVSGDLFAVLSAAAVISSATGGAFDITSAPLSGCWGFLRREGRLPSGVEIERARECVGMHLVELGAAGRTVYFRRPGVTLNLGAIGKGFALDRMADRLESLGTRHALLSAGSSSIRALGREPFSWGVDLRTATTGDLLARLRMSDAAVGTSGAGEQYFEVDGIRYGHVIDPRTGWPASGVLSASAITTNAAAADALSTAFLIGGIDLARRYCARHRDVLAIITPNDTARRPLMFGSHPGVRVELA